MNSRLFPALLLAVSVLFILSGCVRFEDGDAAFRKGDYATAFDKWRLLAKYGDAKAQNELGWLYQQGLDRKSVV